MNRAPNVLAAVGRETGIRHRDACYADANYRVAPRGPERSSPMYRDGDIRRCPHGKLQMATTVLQPPGHVPSRTLAWRDLSPVMSPLLFWSASRILRDPAPSDPHAWVPLTPPRGPSGISRPAGARKRLTPGSPS